MRNRSFLGRMARRHRHGLCRAVAPYRCHRHGADSRLAYACRQGCNIPNGCSWPFGKYTVWHPHVECRITIGTITCRDSTEKAPWYTQRAYRNADCTGQLLDTINIRTHRTASRCEAIHVVATHIV